MNLKQRMEERNQLLRIARETKSPTDWQHYLDMRNRVKALLREAEKEHIQQELQHCDKNSSRWKVINNCIPRRESFRPTFTGDLKTIANEFNEFFSSVGARAAEKSASLINEHQLESFTSPNETVQYYLPESEKFYFRAVTSEEILKIVSSFPSNKAPGYDKVSMSVIKDALPCILSSITDIVNHSLLSSVFPASWKISEVVPLPKDGDHEEANNNRPISLLPAMSKICERVALNQITDYMKTNNRLTEHQSGNKAQHSTETINVMMTDRFLEAMDNKKLSLMVLLDLSKAFDSIDHVKLITKMLALGLSSHALEWFKSYLSERQQFVRIGCESSELRVCSYGVPQGSILGPALFNFYINDLPDVPDHCSLDSYVDDSKLLITFPIRDTGSALQHITKDLKKVASWCSQNSLLINPDKTKVLLIGTHQMLRQSTNEDLSITLLGKVLRPAASAKDLGIHIDPRLSFDEHITSITSSCLSSLCQINRVKHLLDKQTLINVMNALIFSRLFYCSSVWGNTSNKNIDKLQSVQNFAARIVTNKRKFDRITPILKEMEWLPVKGMVKYKDGLLTFKCLHEQAPTYLTNKFRKRSDVHKRNTRNKNMIDIPHYRTATGQRTFHYRAVTLWNSLPKEITDLKNINTFKRHLRQHLLAN